MKKTPVFLIALSSLFFVACSNQNNNDNATPASPSSSTVASSGDNTSSTDSQGNTPLSNLPMTTQEAIDLYNENYPDSDITQIELEMSLGKPIYQVSGRNNTEEFEIRFDATSKEIISQQTEQVDRDEQNDLDRQQDAIDVSNIITADEAASIASNAVSGTVDEIKLDKDDGVVFWEVKLKEGQMENEVKINAESGDVLTTEQDD
ncbi:PepSY domain-containing protein [Enterococcus sp. AZ103]|uniref:PepSY domain-containing protein n=1 Tax=Enterococcus sp. AZ103 TaxID=2774628 RepID=UPI003F2165C4